MPALVRSIAGSIELNGPRVARLHPTRDADGITRLRQGESVRIS